MTYASKFKVSLAALMLAMPLTTAQIASADIVQNDDVIVQFSLCVGNDCVNGEAFSFDTIRLKENNLRIHFDDTSNSASFPANDWRILINETGNGGRNYFAVEDATASRIPFRVEAGAQVHNLVVEADGDIGIKTLEPIVDIHVVEGNTPTLRLDQDGSDGFNSQIYDIAGNETNFFIRDVTNGSRLVFRMRPGARADAIHIAADSQVGLGTDNPEAALHIVAAGNNAGFKLDNGATGEWDFVVRNADGELALNDSNTTGGDFIFKTADSNANLPWELVHRADDGFGINAGDNPGAELILSRTGNLTVLGTITSSGPTCASGCDAVFDADYALPSIEDHAEEMFAKRHLPTVGPTSRDNPINLTEHMGNVLNELEKAHIYIAQLNERNKTLEAELLESKDSLKSELLARNAELELRLSRLEATLK